MAGLLLQLGEMGSSFLAALLVLLYGFTKAADILFITAQQLL